MPEILLLSVRFYDGRYHGIGDWPPSPARLFQALVVAAARGQTIPDRPRAALCWLEGLGAPIIAVPRSRAGRGFRNFVPNNDLDAVGGDLRRIGTIRAPKMTRPHFFDATHPFLYAWSFGPGEAAGSHAQTIAHVAECLYQLGRGIDMAWAWAEALEADEIAARLARDGGAIFRPTGGGAGTALPCPQPGSLKSLEDRFEANQRRFTTIGIRGEQLYSQPPKPRFRAVVYNSPPARLLFALRENSGRAAPDFAPWVLTRSVELVTMVRDAATSRLRDKLPEKAALIERVLVGRDATDADKAARVRIIPLPSVGHAYADHAIRRILLEIPPNCEVPSGDLEWGFSGLNIGADYQTGEVISENVRVLTAQADRGMLRSYGIETPLLARVWRTITPTVLPQPAVRRRIDSARRLKPPRPEGASERAAKENCAVGAVIQALRHADIRASVAAIRVQREPFTGKGERAESFAPGTRFPKERLWHVEISFADPVAGPLIIGDGRYLGLGLMQPIDTANRDMMIFGLAAGSPVATSDRAALLTAVRRALMSLSRDRDGSVPRLFSGHETNGAPAQSGRHEHVFLAAADLDGDGRIDRLIVAAPWRCDRSVQPDRGSPALFERAASALEVVRAGKLGVVCLALDAAGTEDARFVGPARIWESHACYRPTRPVRSGDDPAEVMRSDVAAECRRRGLPAPDVELMNPPNDCCGLFDTPLRLCFAVSILGPIILGRDSHIGGGLFLPRQGAARA
jgi:CRISPR-associated protein Csb2